MGGFPSEGVMNHGTPEHISNLLAGEKTSVCGGARDRLMVLPVRAPLGFTFRSDDNHVRTFCFIQVSFLKTCMIGDTSNPAITSALCSFSAD